MPSLTAKPMPMAILSLALATLLLLWPCDGRSDTPDPRVKLGPWAGDLKVGAAMNAAGKNLRECEFVSKYLSGSVFDGSDLSGVRFWNCDLSGASFRGANLTGAIIDECDVKGADFTDATIQGLRVAGPTDFSAPQFMSTRSYKTKDFRDCVILIHGDEDLPGGPPVYDFRGANLAGAMLRYMDLTGSDFTDARIDRIQLQACNITLKQLSATKNFKDRSLRHMVFSVFSDEDPDLSGFDLTGSRFAFGLGRHARIDGAIINECRIGTSVRKEDLYSTRSYRDGDLSRIVFDHMDLAGWDFSRQNVTRCKFWQCSLAGANFEGAIITGVSFDRSTDPSLTGPTVEQVKSTWNYKHGRMAGIVLPKDIAEAVKTK